MASDVTVEGWGSGQRFDVYLAKAGLAASRSKAREAIDAGEVLLGGKRVSAHILVREGQEIVFVPRVAAVEEPLAVPVIGIVHKDADYFVVEKPAGIVVHGGPGIPRPYLTDALVALDPAIARVGEPERPGLVHRLDRDVSGLLLVARTPRGYDYLTGLFAAHGIEKIYTALVHGKVEDEVGEIRLKIARSTRHARMAARPESQEGKTATTRYDVLERFPNATLLSVRILTGRTHQIRAHLFGIGHPVVGDRLYALRRKSPLALGRPFLHATRLRFTDPAGVERTFESPLPEDLAALLRTLHAKYSRTPRT